MDDSQPKDVRTMPKREYRKAKAEMLRNLSVSQSQARDTAIIEQIKAAPDDNARRRILRQYGSR